MIKEANKKDKEMKDTAFETFKAMFYSGKVKPALNKILAQLENDSKNTNLLLLACECLVRTKNFDDLASYADAAIESAPKNAKGYYYKGIAFHGIKGKEQEALKNFNEALTIDQDNTSILKSKAETHFALYSDYHLPLKFAEKHRAKAEESYLKIVELTEQMESPTYTNYLTLADVNMKLTQPIIAKKYYIRAVNAYEAAEETDQNKNIYKDIIKNQKACVKLLEKFTE